MKFKINKKILDDALEIVSKYVDPLSTFYSFRCVLVKIESDFITLRAANDATNIIKKLVVDDVNIKVEETGEFLVQSNIFKSIIKKLSGNITISKTVNNLLDIVEGNSNYQISTLDENTFPVIDSLFNTKKIEINTNELKKAIKNVYHASSEDNNLIYRCINMRYKNSAINFTATDSHRLAAYKMIINNMIDDKFDISVDAEDLKDLIPSDAPKIVELFYNDVKVGIKYENTIVVSRVVTIPFRDTDPIFNDMNIQYNISIDKNVFNNILNKIWISNGDKQNRISISVNSSEFKIVNNVSEIGSFVDSTSDFKFEGKPFQMDLNYNFLKDAISVFDGEISILIDEHIKKILILSSSNKNSKQLITPLRR
ncbi:DNA polymerase III subunit beta [Mycoplasma simbae]|uniref:DNA polymerase III subunit beta n=1 Tax=Mycoplasma simbae TaxID=36744 RepID=UPI000497C3D3|nr:DNA polymerase III subunit beta [Mycoplasma simbae]